MALHQPQVWCVPRLPAVLTSRFPSPYAFSRDNLDTSTQITKSKRILRHGLFTVSSQSFQTSIRCSVQVMTDDPGPSGGCAPCTPAQQAYTGNRDVSCTLG